MQRFCQMAEASDKRLPGEEAMEFQFVWTNGSDEAFARFYRITEAYYSAVGGGEENRKQFIPYNLSAAVEDVLLVYCGDTPVACSGLKMYAADTAEVKRVWVEPAFRRKHLAERMMRALEGKAREAGYHRMILQTREIMKDAVSLYTGLGYRRIANYPPYDRLEGAVCFEKILSVSSAPRHG